MSNLNFLSSFSSKNALMRNVEKHEGAVDPATARRYLNHIFYNSYGQTPTELSSLPPETKLNLYEAVAEENNPRNALYLNALNEEMGLTKGFYAQNAQSVDSFFADSKKLEAAWTKSQGTQTSYSAVMQKIVNKDPNITYEETTAALKFMAEEYSKHCGVDNPKLVFYEGKPESLGYQRDGEVGINLSSPHFMKNPDQLINTLVHEVDHMKQDMMGTAYRAGKITEKDPDYFAARVFAANIKTRNGYISPKNLLGHQAYEQQPVEIASRYAGERAVTVAANKYSDPSRPVDSFKHKSPHYHS